MLSKISAAVIGLLLVLGLGSSAVAGVSYPVAAPGASVSSATVAPGGTVTFTATGFQPGSTVTVTSTGGSDTRTVTVTASAAGAISLPVTLGSAGRWTIAASGTGADGNPLTVSSTVLVSAGAATTPAVRGNAASTGGSLARTGVDGLATTAWVGFGVLVLGGVLVAVASGRGRSRQDA